MKLISLASFSLLPHQIFALAPEATTSTQHQAIRRELNEITGHAQAGITADAKIEISSEKSQKTQTPNARAAAETISDSACEVRLMDYVPMKANPQWRARNVCDLNDKPTESDGVEFPRGLGQTEYCRSRLMFLCSADMDYDVPEAKNWNLVYHRNLEQGFQDYDEILVTSERSVDPTENFDTINMNADNKKAYYYCFAPQEITKAGRDVIPGTTTSRSYPHTQVPAGWLDINDKLPKDDLATQEFSTCPELIKMCDDQAKSDNDNRAGVQMMFYECLDSAKTQINFTTSKNLDQTDNTSDMCFKNNGYNACLIDYKPGWTFDQGEVAGGQADTEAQQAVSKLQELKDLGGLDYED